MINYRAMNQKVTYETIKITENGFYIKNDKRIDLIGEDLNKAILILPDDIKNFNLPKSGNSAEIFVSSDDSFTAAKKLNDCLVMNFASATSPGGGFLSGANAQEENLCRESTLYKSISSDEANGMYSYNNRHSNPCKYNAMILSPNVCVFRNVKDELLDEPFLTSVITIPALNKNGGARNISQDIIDEVMKERLRNMFIVATHFNYTNLILGAWGCGAFGHNPNIVSNYFYEILFDENFISYFDKIVFAILDKGEMRNLNAFKEKFAKKISK